MSEPTDEELNAPCEHTEVAGQIDWSASPPFITSISGSGTYEVSIKVHSMAELHAAHDLVMKAFSDAHSDLLQARWRDANQG